MLFLKGNVVFGERWVRIMANLGYVRVSTVEQNDERQKEAFEKYNIDKCFEEKVSGKDTKRKKL